MVKFLYSDTKNKDMYYAVGMDFADPIFYLDTGEKKYVFLDYRELGVFNEQNKNKEIEAIALDPIMEEAEKNNKDSVSIEKKVALYLMEKYEIAEREIEVSNILQLDMADYLRAKGVRIKVISSFFPERMRKKEGEIQAIRENLEFTKKAFQRIEKVLKESVIDGGKVKYNGKILTSEILKREVRHSLLNNELMDIEGMIISCGKQAAIPHHSGSGEIKPNQTIICDIFPQSRKNGYFADMTRTYVKGEVGKDVKELYETVKEVQEKAVNAIKPGVRGSEIYKLCVEEFAKKGHGVGEKGFAHGTGHGLGLDVHEGPYLNARYHEKLEPGNVVTVEPGLYYPEIGGVRIEDVVVVTENGYENLTNYPKKLRIF